MRRTIIPLWSFVGCFFVCLLVVKVLANALCPASPALAPKSIRLLLIGVTLCMHHALVRGTWYAIAAAVDI